MGSARASWRSSCDNLVSTPAVYGGWRSDHGSSDSALRADIIGGAAVPEQNMIRIGVLIALFALVLTESVVNFMGGALLAAVAIALLISFMAWKSYTGRGRFVAAAIAALSCAAAFAIFSATLDAEICADFAFLWIACAIVGRGFALVKE